MLIIDSMATNKNYEKIVERLALLSNLNLNREEISLHAEDFPKLLSWMNKISTADLAEDFKSCEKHTEGESDTPLSSLDQDLILKIANKSENGYVCGPKPKGRKS